MDNNLINESDLVVFPAVDAENILIDSEIQVMDDDLIDPDAENNFLVTPVILRHLEDRYNFVIDDCLFLLSKDEDKLAKFVEDLKTIKKEVEIQVPKPTSQKTRDVFKDIYTVEKPKKNKINNPQVVRNKGGLRGARRKSGREITLKARAKHSKKYGHREEKTNNHTKTTCPGVWFMNTSVYSNQSNALDEMRDSLRELEFDEDEDEDEQKEDEDEEVDEEGFKLLEEPVQNCGEIYKKIEGRKRQQIMELEKMRMDFL
uniref:Uncharacterized protein n=1 Tax=Tanacetum cinerariifolium TaxID=118510 RepID=A0A6L2M8B0_TANCI|nr:hypothetical protein [Tanacetum cinerariifolium]